MKKVYVAILFLATALPATAGSLRFTQIPGHWSSNAKKDLGTIQGDEFDKIKPKIQTVVSALLTHNRWVPKEATWWTSDQTQGTFRQWSILMEKPTLSIRGTR